MELERTVLDVVKSSEERGDPPLVWAVEVGRCVQARGMELPSLELGETVVGSLCFANNTPSLWKFLDQALASGLLSPLHTLALLTARVIPYRQIQPEAYRLYLELLNRYTLSFSSKEPSNCREKIAKSVNDALQLTHNYEVTSMDFGKVLILFFFTVVTRLIDGTLEDLGLQLAYSGKGSGLPVCTVNQDFHTKEYPNDKRREYREHLCKRNTLMAIEVAEKLTADKKAKVLLRLVHKNMPETFNCLLQRLQFIQIQMPKSQNLIFINHILVRLSANIQRAMDEKFQLNKCQPIGGLINVGSHDAKFCTRYVVNLPACWVPFDIFMENTMDGKHLYASSAIDILTELTMTLQVINQASWQETFQALWISALRLVQREHEPVEGPIPHLDARLCILLSITPLAIVSVMKQEAGAESFMKSDAAKDIEPNFKEEVEENQYSNIRRGLISSIQLLRQFCGLLSPPPSVVIAANNAAGKGASFVSNFKNGTKSCNSIHHSDTSVEAVGTMLHLIVEACIARKLIDTSAYFWPGYVVTSSTLPMNPSLTESSPWLTFMEGAQLTKGLTSALMVTPASSVTEVEKLYHIALNGSEEERSTAAKIICGATLSQGWNIQEHVVHFVIKLLSTPVPSDFPRPGSHLFGYMSMINSIVFGLCRIDIVHIISVYGMVPNVAAALMPLCEAFGSLSPTSNYRSSMGEETSVYSIFSCAFLFLLRLWKFYRPPQEHCLAGRWTTVRDELTLDYLLLMHNDNVALNNSDSMDRGSGIRDHYERSSVQPVYTASFPKLRAWHFQNQACIASTLSALSNGNPVHQVANKILTMICRKMTFSGNSSSNLSSTSSSNLSGSPINSGEDAYQRPMLPAWEFLESLPFVLDALLTACAHGRLSSRDLTTGLRDIVDFLPASLATIVSYFSAEISRGIWKPVQMNGIEWPNPAPNLLSIEAEIKDILASAGVHVPTCYAGGATPVMLPLPIAALVSLTITFRLDKSMEYVHGIAGSALENCATGCPWPCMPIIGALWAQKVRRWHDFIVVSCARSPFERDQGAIRQLLRSCFTSFLGPSLNSALPPTARGGVNGLLGHALSHNGVRQPVAPGLLYLRSCRKFYDTHFVTEEILKLVVESARQVASGWACGGPARLRSGRTSLAAAATAVKEAAMLGASLLCIAGGMQLVPVLYREMMPTWLLSAARGAEGGPAAGSTCRILEGYAMAYMLVLSGSFVWGLGQQSSFWRPSAPWRVRSVRAHTEFVAGALEGNITLGCDPATWKAYVSCLLGLMVQFTPSWVAEVEPGTLRSLASGLRGWHECDLALSLLERGGPAAITSVVESIS
uniref:GMP synthase [glutamine-hydrolyzing] n=2 Tax=Anthurium amnicola TaxID=1678845 RepID=A0A1D1Y8M9_9ARAE